MTRPDQLTREQLKDMTPDQIVAAKAAGRLDDLLGTTTWRPPDAGCAITREYLRTLTPEQTIELDRLGRLDQLLGRTIPTDPRKSE